MKHQLDLGHLKQGKQFGDNNQEELGHLKVTQKIHLCTKKHNNKHVFVHEC